MKIRVTDKTFVEVRFLESGAALCAVGGRD
jgi:hypothetical protein